MYTQSELAVLADRYSQATRITLAALGEVSTRNRKAFKRLVILNKGINAATAERASRWFDENWPAGIDWPPEVPDRRRVAQPVRDAAGTAA